MVLPRSAVCQPNDSPDVFDLDNSKLQLLELSKLLTVGRKTRTLSNCGASAKEVLGNTNRIRFCVGNLGEGLRKGGFA